MSHTYLHTYTSSDTCARARQEESRPVHSTSPPALLRHGFIFNRATHHGTRLSQLCCITPGASPFFSLSLSLSLHLSLRVPSPVDLSSCPAGSFSFLRGGPFFLSLPSWLAATLVFIARDGRDVLVHVARVCFQGKGGLAISSSSSSCFYSYELKEIAEIIERLIIARSAPTVSNRVIACSEIVIAPLRN